MPHGHNAAFCAAHQCALYRVHYCNTHHFAIHMLLLHLLLLLISVLQKLDLREAAHISLVREAHGRGAAGRHAADQAQLFLRPNLGGRGPCIQGRVLDARSMGRREKNPPSYSAMRFELSKLLIAMCTVKRTEYL